MRQLYIKHLTQKLLKPKHPFLTGKHYVKYVTTTHSSKSVAVEKEKPLNNENIKPLQVGDKVHGFRVQQVEEVAEFQLTAIRLLHEGTGGQYLHIDRNDSNNAFSIGFRTTPNDSTGVPHILEHTVLCGSHKYPCRDPFFKMLNRSLATFMNAMTGPDFTIYPFSTQNIKDYENLMSVYLDAVYRPLLNYNDFKQEGWRLEYTDPKDKNTPITLKGVVYNEMKGVFSENQNIFYEAIQNNLLPSHTYGICSGGDPLVIPQLTYDTFKKFHQFYYSPSNAKYYSYGNFPLKNHLKYLNENYLSSIPNAVKNTEVPDEKRWTTHVRKHIMCRPDPMASDPNKTSSVAVCFLCASVTDLEEIFMLHVLSELLVVGPNSAFYKSLVEPNIGSGLSPVTGYSAQTKDTMFCVGLQGVSDQDFDKIIKIIDNTIDDVIDKGFDSQRIEGILHGIELHTKHQSSDFGLGLLFNLATLWTHDGNVIDSLKVESHVKTFRNNIKNTKYLKNKVKQYLKNNSHKLILTMTPDNEYEKKQKQKEEEVLKNKVMGLTEKDKAQIYEKGLELLKQQEKVQDVTCLPTLRIKDLNKDIEHLQYIDKNISGVNFQIVEQPTNGVTYLRGLINVHDLESNLKPLLPLFTKIATRMGTKKYSYQDLDQVIQLKTGGLSVGSLIVDDLHMPNKYEECVSIGSYCLNQNVDDMFDLWVEVLNNIELSDIKRYETLVKVTAANLVNSIIDSGHHYAMSLSASLVSDTCLLKEKYSGLTFIKKMKDLSQSSFEESLNNNIKNISQFLVNNKNIRICLNILEGTEQDMSTKSGHFVQTLMGNAQERKYTHNTVLGKTQGCYYLLPADVSYTSKSVESVTYEHEDYAALRILSRYLTMKYLLKEVREKGGAYGAGLSVNPSGVLSFYSYRDPNPINTFSVFDNTVAWMKEQSLKSEDLEEAKLGVFQSIDAPVPPGSKGLRRFLSDIDDETFEKHRLKLMNVTIDDLYEVAEKYLQNKNCGRSVLGPENKLLLENKEHNWKIIDN